MGRKKISNLINELGGGIAPTIVASAYKGPGNTQDGMVIAYRTLPRGNENARENNLQFSIVSRNQGCGRRGREGKDERIGGKMDE